MPVATVGEPLLNNADLGSPFDHSGQRSGVLGDHDGVEPRFHLVGSPGEPADSASPVLEGTGDHLFACRIENPEF